MTIVSVIARLKNLRFCPYGFYKQALNGFNPENIHACPSTISARLFLPARPSPGLAVEERQSIDGYSRFKRPDSKIDKLCSDWGRPS
jgi:hypothetical protein